MNSARMQFAWPELSVSAPDTAQAAPTANPPLRLSRTLEQATTACGHCVTLPPADISESVSLKPTLTGERGIDSMGLSRTVVLRFRKTMLTLHIEMIIRDSLPLLVAKRGDRRRFGHAAAVML